MTDNQITTAEIVQCMKDGEKIYRSFKRGLEVAEIYQEMESRVAAHEKHVDDLMKNKTALRSEIKDLTEAVPEKKKEADKIIADAQSVVSEMIAKANAKIKDAQDKAAANIGTSESILDGLKQQIVASQNKIDDLNAEVKRLTAIQEETKARVLAGT